MLEAGELDALDPSALQSGLSHLDDAPLPKTLAPVFARAAGVPEPLRSYIGGGLDDVRWTKIACGISFKSVLKSGDAHVQLIRSKAGQGVRLHTHRGEEFTLVLTGGYTDVTGHRTRGDLHSTIPEVVHRPLADEGEDCIVLVVSDALLKFRNPGVALIGKWFGY